MSLPCVKGGGREAGGIVLPGASSTGTPESHYSKGGCLIKRKSAFVWSLALAGMAVLGFLCLPSPLYAFGASSIVHAIYLIVGVDNRIFACLMLLYLAVWSVYLLVCCVLSYKGAVRPTVIAAGADLLVSAAYILYVLCAAPDTPPYFSCELAGFAVRILATVLALMHIRTARRLPAQSESKV